MGEAKPCRCCLALGSHKDINATYYWMNKKEIYARMLRECFNIVLSPSPQNGNGICHNCVFDLRAADNFKRTVLLTEQELLKKSIEISGLDEKAFEVKLEPCDSGDDSDDYFLADAVRDAQEAEVKTEVADPVKKRRQSRNSKRSISKKMGSEDWQYDEVKHLVNKLTNVGNNELTIKKKKEIKGIPVKVIPVIKCLDSKPRTLVINPDYRKNSKKELKFSSKASQRNNILKHKENLITILENSNVIPFKDKSLLGYICGYCESTFPDPQDLRTHTEMTHKIDRLKYKSNFDMTDFCAKIDITDLQCTLCNEKFDNLKVLREHLVKIHNKTIHNDIKDHMLQFKLKKGDVYNCAMCPAMYETFKMLKQHMNKHYSNYKCNKCESSFATKRSLQAHTNTHIEGTFKCNKCDKVFSSKPKLQYHEKCKHLGARNISNCPYCNEPFRSYYQRNQHLIKVHNNEAQYKCNVCNKTYVLKSLLMYHIKKSHLMEKNYQCTDCGYRFFSKKALKAHMVKHTGERNFACHVCLKSYARKYTLREHMRIHNNDRRFKCDICAMTFVQKCSLKSHLLSNHGVSLAASDITTTDSSKDVC